MRATLLGFTVPDELLEQIHANDRLMQTQTHRFAWSLVNALRSNAVDVDLLSSAPVSDFPGNRQLVWRGRRFETGGVRGRLMPFVNLVVLKHLTRYLSCWLVGTRELRRTRPEWLVVHGVHSPFLYYAVHVRRRIGTRVVVVLTDPPGVIRREDGLLRRTLKSIDIKVVRGALRRADALVVLAEPLATDFAPDVPALVVEGLVAASFESTGLRESLPPAQPPRVVFAGGLHEEYGVKLLVEAFRSLPGDVELHLFGRGPLEGWLIEQSREDERIQAPRLVSPEELPAIYANASVLVQPRPPDQHFVRYSFPSKLIEYLASGTPTVSTRLPSIPADYEPHVVWSEVAEPRVLAEAIAAVLAEPTDVSDTFGRRAAEFINETRSARAQGQRIVEFLSSARNGERSQR